MENDVDDAEDTVRTLIKFNWCNTNTVALQVIPGRPEAPLRTVSVNGDYVRALEEKIESQQNIIARSTIEISYMQDSRQAAKVDMTGIDQAMSSNMAKFHYETARELAQAAENLAKVQSTLDDGLAKCRGYAKSGVATTTASDAIYEELNSLLGKLAKKDVDILRIQNRADALSIALTKSTKEDDVIKFRSQGTDTTAELSVAASDRDQLTRAERAVAELESRCSHLQLTADSTYAYFEHPCTHRLIAIVYRFKG